MSEKARLFEYVAIYNPTKEEAEEGVKPKVIVDVQRILTKDEQVASMLAIKAIPKEYDEKLAQVNIVVRPS